MTRHRMREYGRDAVCGYYQTSGSFVAVILFWMGKKPALAFE
jgi:hypothetical protein